MTVQDVQQSTIAYPYPDESFWPLLKSERTWTPRKLAMVLTVTACATWCYIIGEYVGYYLDLKMGIAAMITGAMIGILIVTLAVVPAATRYGIDSITASVPQFGSRGWVLTIIPQYASIIGWNAILLIFFGQNVAEILKLIGYGSTIVSAVAPVVTIMSCLICFAVLRAGATGLERVSAVLFFFIVGVGLWMVYLLLHEQSVALSAAKPAYASESRQWNYVTGIEILLASNLSWWAYAGAMVRQSPSASVATLPTMIGMGFSVPMLSIVGLASILALQTSNPSTWLVQLGGPTYGGVALVFVAAANFGTILAGVYSSTVGLSQVGAFRRVPWNGLLGLNLLPILFMGLVVPDLVFNNFGTFLAFIGLVFGPICGIQIVDYLILRKGKLSVRGLYDRSEGSPYHYWYGINPAGIFALASGFGTYLYLLNPLTYESRFPYEWTTASLPAVLVSGLVYYFLTIVLAKADPSRNA